MTSDEFGYAGMLISDQLDDDSIQSCHGGFLKRVSTPNGFDL